MAPRGLERKKNGVHHAITRAMYAAGAELNASARTERGRQLAAAVAYMTQRAHEGGMEKGALDEALNSKRWQVSRTTLHRAWKTQRILTGFDEEYMRLKSQSTSDALESIAIGPYGAPVSSDAGKVVAPSPVIKCIRGGGRRCLSFETESAEDGVSTRSCKRMKVTERKSLAVRAQPRRDDPAVPQYTRACRQDPELVARVCQLGCDGHTPSAIDRRLSTEGFKNSSGRPWAAKNDGRVVTRILLKHGLEINTGCPRLRRYASEYATKLTAQHGCLRTHEGCDTDTEAPRSSLRRLH